MALFNIGAGLQGGEELHVVFTGETVRCQGDVTISCVDKLTVAKPVTLPFELTTAFFTHIPDGIGHIRT